MRYYMDKAYRDDLHRQVNQVTQQYVGKTWFDEDTFQHSPKRIENLFGCEFSYYEGSTPWLTPTTEDPAEFARLLDQAEATDVATWSFPPEFLEEWEERRGAGKALPKLGTGSRGPATIMTSVLKPETVFYWMYDHPDLMTRFRDITGGEDGGVQPHSAHLQRQHHARLVDHRRQLRPLQPRFTGSTASRCWTGCSMRWRRVTPRYQHSDSSMGHLLDMQYELGIRRVNYGPEVDAGRIRAEMPARSSKARCRPSSCATAARRRSSGASSTTSAKPGAGGGLQVATAGSLAAGTGVGRMRWFMQLVQTHCRYDCD
ncbi:MAG: hypothetical protein R2838_26235 [Caldilineaceae bacterium]